MGQMVGGVSLSAELPVHFFTFVLNGMPFIRHHIEVMRTLSFDWHWHIVEGYAKRKGARMEAWFHRDGRSIDGTSDYLDQLAAVYPNEVTVYRKPIGQFWDSEIEMVNAPLSRIKTSCLLWELDVDEFWTAAQIVVGRRMFVENPSRYAAFFWCNYFVGPRLHIITRGGYGNNMGIEWVRAFRFEPGFFWLMHEPPVLADQSGMPIARRGMFSHAETEQRGLVFQHFAYVIPYQLAFKETYHGYRDAPAHWRRLQRHDRFPVRLCDYFPWVKDGTLVARTDSAVPLLRQLGVV